MPYYYMPKGQAERIEKEMVQMIPVIYIVFYICFNLFLFRNRILNYYLKRKVSISVQLSYSFKFTLINLSVSNEVIRAVC
jgi:hypothetical protein